MSRHYFVSLSFADDGGRIRNITLKTKKKRVTAPLIRQALHELVMTENASLLSVNWLGRMSDEEYAEEQGDGKVRALVPWLVPVALSLILIGWALGRLI